MVNLNQLFYHVLLPQLFFLPFHSYRVNPTIKDLHQRYVPANIYTEHTKKQRGCNLPRCFISMIRN